MDQVLPALPAESRPALARAVAEAAPALRAFVRRRVRDLADAEDIVQDTFLELSGHYSLSEPIEHVAAWLARVARHRIIDRYRTRARAALRYVEPVATADDEPERVVDAWRAPAADGPEGAYLREQMLGAVTHALESLPAEQRDVFVAHEFEGKNFKELAAETGTPVNTLLGRKHAAVKLLRERLDGYRSFLDELEDT